MTYGFSYAPYNDLEAFKNACTENTIAIMIEPVQGEGGVHPATMEFMKGLREFCDEKQSPIFFAFPAKSLSKSSPTSAKLEKLPHIKEVRHQGLLVGVEFDDTISGVDVKHGCLDRKLLITAIGAHVIRMVPPLIVSAEECDKAYAIIEETVKSLEK